MNRDFKGVWIPKEIWFSDLSLVEKILFTEIHSLDTNNGCFAGNDYFASFMKCSNKTISRAISNLKKLKLIKEDNFDGRNRILKTNIEKISNLKVNKCLDKMSSKTVCLDKMSKLNGQNVPYINTDINTNISLVKDILHNDDIVMPHAVKNEDKTIGKLSNDLLKYFANEYETTFGNKPVLTNWARYNKQASKYIKTYGYEKMKEFIDSYFSSNDKFFKDNNYPIGVFLTDLAIQKLNVIKELSYDDICRIQWEEEQRKKNEKKLKENEENERIVKILNG